MKNEKDFHQFSNILIFTEKQGLGLPTWSFRIFTIHSRSNFYEANKKKLFLFSFSFFCEFQLGNTRGSIVFCGFCPRREGCKTLGTRLNEPTRIPQAWCAIQDIDIGPFPPGSLIVLLCSRWNSVSRIGTVSSARRCSRDDPHDPVLVSPPVYTVYINRP